MGPARVFPPNRHNVSTVGIGPADLQAARRHRTSSLLSCVSLTTEIAMNERKEPARRRDLLKTGLALAASAAAGTAGAQHGWIPSSRYPDPAVEILDPSFARYRLFSASVERSALSRSQPLRSTRARVVRPDARRAAAQARFLRWATGGRPCSDVASATLETCGASTQVLPLHARPLQGPTRLTPNARRMCLTPGGERGRGDAEVARRQRHQGRRPLPPHPQREANSVSRWRQLQCATSSRSDV